MQWRPAPRQDCIFNQIPYPHGTHVHADKVALYPAGNKRRPNYLLDLRDGHIEIAELMDFVE
jgi:hypothetical protein